MIGGQAAHRAGRWSAARRLLAVRLDAMGDLLMTTPALRALKAARPDRHLTVLTSSAGRGIAALVPEVDAVIAYDAPWMKATPRRRSAGGEYALARRLAAGRFEAAVIFTVYSQSPLPAALLCWLAGVPLRLAHCRENPYQLLTDWVPDPEPARVVRHEVRRQLDLVGAVGATTRNERLSLQVPAAARARVRARLERLGVGREPWVLLHPGATAPSRRYPGESFAEVVRGLRAAGVPVVLAGGSRLDDLELLTRMEQAVGAGAIGCSVGRNIFMHPDPEAITRALSRVIRERWTAEEAHRALLEELEGRR
ncbi:MAG TPA: glycosyltransferase family 9 protein [Candidatus Binatia bacterium]|nr:glycosyltransferase family 9 protein [Candidatus Binatia bacterium]